MGGDRSTDRAARRIDLNLARVFVAVFETRSVTRAAERLCVAQPTVSYGLAELRRILQDQLFVRTREGMVPNSQAQQVYRDFTAALCRIDGAIEDSRHFAPLTSRRRFLVAMSDIGELVFLPPLLHAIRAKAPNVALEVVEATPPDLGRRLATGKASVAIGNLPGLFHETRSQELFEERYVCMLSKRHSSIRSKLTLNQFTAANHVNVASGSSGHNLVEETLQNSYGIQRRIALHIPHFSILARLIATSDLLVMLPSRVSRLFESYEDVRSLEPPVPIPPFVVRLYWHEDSHQNATNKWFRGLIVDALTGI
jgi:DNA-binding transcriptional LysR family regulator